MSSFPNMAAVSEHGIRCTEVSAGLPAAGKKYDFHYMD